MTKEDILLGVQLGKLHIEPYKLNKIKSNDNPFSTAVQHTKSYTKQKFTCASKCSCISEKYKSAGICKNKQNKLIKQPILNILRKSINQNVSVHNEDKGESSLSKNAFNIVQDHANLDPLNLCTLVQNCNQLKISSGTRDQREPGAESPDLSKWWKSDMSSSSRESKESVQSSRGGTCSQQALNPPPPCDITIDELASYFETLVHIPKKMSSMAEMMYI